MDQKICAATGPAVTSVQEFSHFERLLAERLGEFINLPVERVDGPTDHAFRRIVETLDMLVVPPVYLWSAYHYEAAARTIGRSPRRHRSRVAR